MEIRIMHRQGKSIRSIAKELSISRWTVRKYLRSPGLEPDYGPRAVRASKLDPFKEYIRRRLRDSVPRRLPATVLMREIRERGYGGGISILKDCWQVNGPRQQARRRHQPNGQKLHQCVAHFPPGLTHTKMLSQFSTHIPNHKNGRHLPSNLAGFYPAVDRF